MLDVALKQDDRGSLQNLYRHNREVGHRGQRPECDSRHVLPLFLQSPAFSNPVQRYDRTRLEEVFDGQRARAGSQGVW